MSLFTAFFSSLSELVKESPLPSLAGSLRTFIIFEGGVLGLLLVASLSLGILTTLAVLSSLDKLFVGVLPFLFSSSPTMI